MVQLQRATHYRRRDLDESRLRSHSIDVHEALDALTDSQVTAILTLCMLTFQSKVIFNDNSPPFLAQFYHFLSKVVGPSTGLDAQLMRWVRGASALGNIFRACSGAACG